nr:immunoglobulin heavy chain junction region [Macaca mulatta]
CARRWSGYNLEGYFDSW